MRLYKDVSVVQEYSKWLDEQGLFIGKLVYADDGETEAELVIFTNEEVMNDWRDDD